MRGLHSYKMKQKELPLCYGTKELSEKCSICRNCNLLSYCKRIKHKKNRL